MIEARSFLDVLNTNGFNPFLGVPCSFLKPLINCAIASDDKHYLSCSNEGEAIAIASGAYLAGRHPVVMMQNSGLGNCVNPLTSLNYVYRIPILMIVTLRGEPGKKDEPQHELMGRITVDLLNLIGIQNASFPDSAELIEKSVQDAQRRMEANGLPFSFVMSKDSVASAAEAGKLPLNFRRGLLMPSGENKVVTLQRSEAIEIITGLLGTEIPVISSTGKISRELYELYDRPSQMYIMGSMGCTASIGLGVAMFHPQRRIAVLDGDGSSLMRLESYISIGHYSPANYLYFVLDNEEYESTGGQQTLSGSTSFPEIAAACGFASAVTVYSRDRLTAEIGRVCESPGPHMIHARVKSGSSPGLGRPGIGPVQLKERFMSFLRNGREGGTE